MIHKKRKEEEDDDEEHDKTKKYPANHCPLYHIISPPLTLRGALASASNFDDNMMVAD